ncbi:MAG: tRNA preQ1(34) S-adenosylmethionine ribosyltransferase-isomerase QueA [Gemmatimonadota bacterium]|nr:MAG: tRNA preQ1(34) S-adenosylmethionine ribosyltransferase-isomerase QueA [Gemmatimonadota bacterium]
MKTSDFDYQLPQELIAQFPAVKRDESRLMVLDRPRKSIEHRRFRDIVEYLNAGDCLVVNETKVFPARLRGKRIPTGGTVEIFLLREQKKGLWEALVQPGRRTQKGLRVSFGADAFTGEIVDRMNDGKRLIQFEEGVDIEELITNWGEVPLPPYVKREPVDTDRIRYQTVYAKIPGAVAAPTAGLHFTDDLLGTIKRKHVHIVPILLHVGPGTFRPVTTDDPREYPMEAEYFEISTETAEIINRAKKKKARIMAIGTTTVKALETAVDSGGRLVHRTGWTDMYIYPPFPFRIVNCLVTNFHLPRSTLIMLVSAFADREFILEAYQKAIEQRYRFYSYGDAMLIL